MKFLPLPEDILLQFITLALSLKTWRKSICTLVSSLFTRRQGLLHHLSPGVLQEPVIYLTSPPLAPSKCIPSLHSVIYPIQGNLTMSLCFSKILHWLRTASKTKPNSMAWHARSSNTWALPISFIYLISGFVLRPTMKSSNTAWGFL